MKVVNVLTECSGDKLTAIEKKFGSFARLQIITLEEKAEISNMSFDDFLPLARQRIQAMRESSIFHKEKSICEILHLVTIKRGIFVVDGKMHLGAIVLITNEMTGVESISYAATVPLPRIIVRTFEMPNTQEHANELLQKVFPRWNTKDPILTILTGENQVDWLVQSLNYSYRQFEYEKTTP